MTKPNCTISPEKELAETVEIYNKIVVFYEEFIGSQTARIAALENENKELKRLLSDSRGLFRDVVKTSKRGVVN
jgi:hypothetical protein